ncbi:MAG: hypothetical protein K2L86_11045, partial [Lachnospiraceae bacterium]|nr:hypothetical protein [Lachnospiraceae bacterium]
FQNEDTPNDAGKETGAAAAVTNAIQTSTFGFMVCLVLLLMVLPMRLVIKKCIWHYRYNHANRSDKLLMRYRRIVRRHFSKELAGAKNFDEQAALLVQNGVLLLEDPKLECLVKTLNKAAYAQEELSQEVFEEAVRYLQV